MSGHHRFVALAAVITACVSLPVYGQQPQPADSGALSGLATAKALSEAFAQVAKRITPAVVNISSTRVERTRMAPMSPLFRRFFPELEDMFVDPKREIQSLGSGVIIRPDGYIVTNWHVVQGAQQITVKLSDEREYEAKPVGQDSFTDLAIVKIQAEGLPAAKMGDAKKLQVGEWVIAVGSPLGLAQTVTAGIVSATGRRNLGLQGYEDFIQTDAAINPGNSGGALVNLDGELVGINTAIASEGGGYDGICFATPTSVVWPVADTLIREGSIKRPWIGIIARKVNHGRLGRAGVDIDGGVLLYNMIRNGPAHRAGLHPGDIILQWAETDISDQADLSEAIQATEIGTEVRVVILRDQSKYAAKVTVTERPQNVPARGIL